MMFGNRVFAYPKPLSLIRSLVRSATRGDDLVLDSFAGSGTTGHAVLGLNAEDGGSRRFVLVEIDEGISRSVTSQRLRKVVEGYAPESERRNVPVEGIGGGFRYCELGDPVFADTGTINSNISFEELAAHVFFTETGLPLGNGWRQQAPLLGVHKDEAVYLLYNGILGDRKPDGGNVLTGPVLASLPDHQGPKVIYGEGCRLGRNRLEKEQIIFRQIPYEIKVR